MQNSNLKNFLIKSAKFAIIISLIVLVVLAILNRWLWGLGLLTGTIWSILNLYATLGLIEIAILKRNKTHLVLLILVKFPVLYLLGYIILVSKIFPVSSLLVGLVPIFIGIGAVKLWPRPLP